MFRSFLHLILGFSILMAFALIPARLRAQQQDQQQEPLAKSDNTIRIGSEEVLLDIIVRDKKGRPIKDLKPEDVEIYEDDQKQRVVSFRQVGRTEHAGNKTQEAATATAKLNSSPDPLRQINLVTMVFDRLGTESRPLARQAAQEFLNSELNQNALVAVDALDRQLRVIQPFTNNRELLQRAIDSATGAVTSQYADHSETMRLLRERIEELDAKVSSVQVGPGGPPANLGADLAEKKMAEITLNTLRFEEELQTTQQGNAVIFALLAMVNGQKQLAGRKTVLFFSEGIQFPPNMAELFRAAISAANRANVSFYAIDARGLLTTRQGEAQRQMLADAAKASASQQRKRGGEAITLDEMKAFDTAESSIQKNGQNTLRSLAEGTGGFLIADTNDLRKPMQRVATELDSYYEVAYSPPPHDYDGRFHSIKVKAIRKDLVVQTRNGYFAVPRSSGKPIFPAEMPMFAALNAASLRRDFNHRVLPLRFVGRHGNLQYAVTLEAPLNQFTFVTEKGKKQYRTDFAVLALIKNETGSIVDHFSQSYPLTGPLDKLEALKKGNLVFTRHFDLPPGRYRLETVLYDRLSRKLSAQRTNFIAPTSAEGIALSNLSIVKRVEPLDNNFIEADNPLAYGNGKIIPAQDEPVIPEPGESLTFYIAVYPDRRSADKPTIAFEFLQNGAAVAREAPPLPAPNERGRIQFVTSVPTTSFPAGTYELRVTAAQGGKQSEERLAFTVTANQHNAAATLAPVIAADHSAAGLKVEAPTEPVELLPVEEMAAANADDLGPVLINTTININIAELLSEVERNSAATMRQLESYTYTVSKRRKVFDETNRLVKEETSEFEAYPISGSHVLVQVKRNGKALLPSEVEAERAKAGRELAQKTGSANEHSTPETLAAPVTLAAPAAETFWTAAISGKYRMRDVTVKIDPLTFLRNCEFFHARTERLDGREVIAFEFRPRPDAKFSLPELFIKNMLGKIWIDAADKMLVRLEARPSPAWLKTQPNFKGDFPYSKLLYQQRKLPTGEWAPHLIRMNAAGMPALFFGLHWDVTFELGEYQRFDTDGELLKINSPKEKP